MSNNKTKDTLNQAVADLSQFAVIIHQAHWYMRGSRFLSLHPQMDVYMDDVNSQLDLIAERLITLGGSPYSTLKEFSSNTKLKEKKGSFSVTEDQHLQTLLTGFTYVGSLYKDGIATATDEGDDVTADLFTSLKGDVDKTVWMLSATLGKEPKLG